MASLWLLVALLCNTMIFIYADGSADVDIITSEEDKICTTELSQCSMNLADRSIKSLLSTPEKGDKGERGFMGDKGSKGDRGLQGVSGERGPKGDKGDKGQEGNPGLPGWHEPKGEKGEPGPTGPQGPPGLPGLMGSCPCIYNKDIDIPGTDDFDKEDKFGPREKPSRVVCKKSHTTFDEPGEYYMGPGPLKVICEVRNEDILTCIPPLHKDKHVEDLETIKVVPGEKPFWLSSKGVNLKTLYNVTQYQILWLQERSNKVFQKIKFHCKNTMAYKYDLFKVDQSLLMSSWNDVTFGPLSSDDTPFSYTIPSELDGCFNSTDKEGFTSSIIEIKSDSPYRLPVVDFLFQDVGDEDKSFRIEHLELCFN